MRAIARWTWATTPNPTGRSKVSRSPSADQAEALHRQQAQHQGHGLLVGEHQRRQLVAGPEPVAAGAAALAFDGDAHLLETGDVAPHGAPVDLQPRGDLRGRKTPVSL